VKKGQAWYLHSANFLVGVTGLIYAYFIYCGQPVDEYSNINSPYQPILQQLHILFAPLLVFGCGMIWMNHAWLMYKSPIATRRRTGTILLFSAWPMILSGVIIRHGTIGAADLEVGSPGDVGPLAYGLFGSS